MNWRDLEQRISQGENLHTEFKREGIRTDDLAAELVAFANTDGGLLIFGVDDNREIVAVTEPDRLAQQIDQVAYGNCQPPLTVLSETVRTPDGKVLLVVRVPKGDLRPYRTRKGDYFIRTSSGKRRASRQELLRLFQAPESFYYEETLILQATLDDLDFRAFRSFREQVVGNGDLDDVQLLIRWRLVREFEGIRYPTVAALLLFGLNPQRFLPHAYLVAARIPGTDTAGEPADHKRVEGTLFDIIEDTARFLNIHLRIAHQIRGFEPERKPELPEEALREFAVNALVHRDYTISAPVRLFVLDDRVEFHSPGNLPNTVTVDMMKAGLAHVLRNPLIYTFFARAGLVTDTGNGIRRAVQKIRAATGAEPEIAEKGNELVVSVPRPPLEPV